MRFFQVDRFIFFVDAIDISFLVRFGIWIYHEKCFPLIDPHTTTTATGVYSTAGDETSGLESSFTSPSAMAPYGGIAGSDGRYQKKEMIEKYLNKSSYLPRDHLTNQAISAANAAQAAAAAVAAAAAAANVTSSSNLTYGTSTFPPSSAPLLSNALASTTAYGMSGLPATNAMLEDLIEGK